MPFPLLIFISLPQNFAFDQLDYYLHRTLVALLVVALHHHGPKNNLHYVPTILTSTQQPPQMISPTNRQCRTKGEVNKDRVALLLRSKNNDSLRYLLTYSLSSSTIKKSKKVFEKCE